MVFRLKHKPTPQIAHTTGIYETHDPKPQMNLLTHTDFEDERERESARHELRRDFSDFARAFISGLCVW